MAANSKSAFSYLMMSTYSFSFLQDEMAALSSDKTAELKDEAPKQPSPASSQKRSTSPSTFRKNCDLCREPNDVLVRCQIDDTATWHFICPKKCWKVVSGGVIDGSSDHSFYRYGGMWKNKHALVSAKKPKHKKEGKEGRGKDKRT